MTLPLRRTLTLPRPVTVDLVLEPTRRAVAFVSFLRVVAGDDAGDGAARRGAGDRHRRRGAGRALDALRALRTGRAGRRPSGRSGRSRPAGRWRRSGRSRPAGRSHRSRRSGPAGRPGRRSSSPSCPRTSSPRRRRCWSPSRGRLTVGADVGRDRDVGLRRRAGDRRPVTQPHVGQRRSPPPENPDGTHVSVEPTTGVPMNVVTPVGSGASSMPLPATTVMLRVEVVTLPALSSTATRQHRVGADVGRLRLPAQLERERDLALHELAGDAEADLLEVAALVDGLDLDLDRVGDADGRALGGPQPGDRRRGRVGRRSAAGAPNMRRTSSLRVAVSVICSRPKPIDTESRVEMIAPPLAVVWPA